MKLIAAAFVLFVVALAAPESRAQHSVGLAWTASSTAAGNPSLTYNVYRSPACTGTFTKLNSTPVAATTILDTTVFTGTYCYQVTAVLAGLESVPSNEVSAAVPASVTPKASCAHRGALIDWIRCVSALPRGKPPAP
jgi:hypothetical protein